MGTSSTPAILRGILVPDPRFKWSATGITSTSQQGPRVGVPNAVDETELLLEASGTQTTTSMSRPSEVVTQGKVRPWSGGLMERSTIGAGIHL